MTEIHGAPPKESGFFANFDASVAVIALLAVGFLVTYVTVGPWEAVRNFGVEALILGAAFWVARTYLPWEDAPRPRVKKPLFELAAGKVAYLLLLFGAYRFFNLQSAWPLFAAGLLIPLVILLVLRYGVDAWGLRLPRSRDWLVLLAVAAIVFALSNAANIWLPEGEIPGPVDTPLRQLTFGGSTLAGLVVMAVGAELFFRVYLQPRLASYLSGRWALFWQAVLCSLMFAPMYLFANGYSLPHSAALTLVLSNGILAGYFWRKTGSLPLLILLHLLAFTRWGL